MSNSSNQHRRFRRSALGSVALIALLAAGRVAKPDADMQQVLDALAALHPKPLPSLSAPEARKQPTPADAVKEVLVDERRDTIPTKLVPGVTSADREVQGAAGPLPARIYTPSGSGPFPVIVYFHGGGWVVANKEVYDGGARGLAAQAKAVVVSPDYRLAPEHKFPAQHEDALAVYRWALKHASEIKGDTSRMALAGESAGGNLAVATAVAARKAGLTMPVHVLSVYPIAQSDTTTASYQENAQAKPLNRALMAWFFRKVSRSPADLNDPRISLVKADLKGLPPVTIVNAQIDPLRDDGLMLERALQGAGVDVARKVYDGATHEFFGMAAVVKDAKDAQAWAGQRLQASFKQSSEASN